MHWDWDYENSGDPFAPLGEEMFEGNPMYCEEQTLQEEGNDEDQVHENLEDDEQREEPPQEAYEEASLKYESTQGVQEEEAHDEVLKDESHETLDDVVSFFLP